MNAPHLATYRSLRAKGMTEADATRTMMREHGLSFDAAVDLAWQAAKGKPAPVAGTLAAERHEAAADRLMGGE